MSTNDPPGKVPLLDWALATTPSPPQASWPRQGGSNDSPKILSLTFTANVPLELQEKQQVVYCDEVRFTITVGASGTDDAALLTSIATGIVPKADGSGAWALVAQDDPKTTNAVVLTRTFDRNGSDKMIVQQGYTFTIDNIQVNSAVGTAEVTVTEHSAGPVALEAAAPADYEWRSKTFSVPKFPPDFGPVRFDAALQSDGTVELTWKGDSSAHGVSYEISRPGAKPLKNLPPSGTTSVGPLRFDTVVTLTVTRDPGDGTKPIPCLFRKTILVEVTAQLEADRDTMLSGETVDLWWYTQNVDDCSIVDDQRKKTSVDGLPLPYPMKVTAGSTIRKATFQLSGTDRFTKDFYTSNLLPVTVLPMARAAKAQLVLIQTDGNPDGRLTIRVNDGARGFQERLRDVETGWTEPGDVGISAPGTESTIWQIFNVSAVKPTPDLAYIEARDSSAGVKVSASEAPGYGNDGLSAPTAFASPATTGFFQLTHVLFKYLSVEFLLNALYFVQTSGTASGNVEVQYAAAPVGTPGPYEQKYVFKPSPYPAYPALDGPKGTWLIADMDGDQVPELVFVRTDPSASRVELSYAKLSDQSSSAQPDKTWVTGFPTVGAGNGSWQLADMTGDGKLDLVFVQTESTASGRVEIHWAVAASDYKHVDGGFTGFDLSLGDAGTWQVIGNDSPYRF